MRSIIFASPIRAPVRAFGIAYGACVIDSIPPAIAISISPDRMSTSARCTAFSPERHTLLIVMHGTSIGTPPFVAAWRAVICPCAACRT